MNKSYLLIPQIKQQLFTKTNKLNSAIIRRSKFKETQLYKNIITITKDLPVDSSISERVYCIFNNINTIPNCLCGKQLSFTTFQVGYKKTCSGNKCKRNNNPKWKSSSSTKKQQSIETLFTFSDQYQNKKYKILSKIEVINFIKQRCKNTNNGILHNFVDTKIYKENFNELCNILDLTNHLFINKDYKWSERFFLLLKDLKNIPLCSVCMKNKTSYINMIEGYRYTCFLNSCISEYASQKRVTAHFTNIQEVIKNQKFIVLNDFTSFKGLNNEQVKLKCIKCGSILEKYLHNGKWQDIYCKGCYGEAGISKEEKEIVKWLKSIYNENIIENQKMPFELDIFLPKHILGIEYHGIFWHSFGKTNGIGNNYKNETKYKYNHLKKLEKCNAANINLLQIFSNEWQNAVKQNIWKSMILNRLKLNQNKIFARKCIIKEIDNTTKNNFLNLNHLQGQDNSRIAAGLYFNDELVALSTFAKSRFNKKYEWELVRFCSKINTNVIGAASRLLKYFEKNYNPKSLISYADRRFSNGNTYRQLGFIHSHFSVPNYFYIKPTAFEIIPRMTAQKHRLFKLLGDKFDQTHTEAENMFLAGYRRVWDCGHFVFAKTY